MPTEQEIGKPTMGKRRLTRRQAWRIEKIQQDRVARANRKTDLAEQQLGAGTLGPEQKGLVIAHFGIQAEVEAVEGELAGTTHRAHLRANLDPLVTGDLVAWRPAATGTRNGDQPVPTGANTTGVVTARMPRDSQLCRPDQTGALRPVAANINQIIITCAPEPSLFPAMLDRYLVAAEHQCIEPLILLNKTDLLDTGNYSELGPMLQEFTDIGYQVLHSSASRDDGLSELQEILRGKTSVFVGQSGVGKSSLINALLPAEDIRVGELSASSGKGRHTTTTARLYHFPQGGNLIDSPGVRDFGLWHLEEAEIARGFRDFAPFLGHCRFRNCRHRKEPGCALNAALREGAIVPRRLSSYHHLVEALQQSG